MKKLHYSGVKQTCFTLKKSFAVIAFLSAVLLPVSLRADEAETPLFKNGNFAERSSRGLPLFWTVRAKDVKNIQIIETDNGNAVRMCPQAGEMMFLLQYPQFKQRGVRYKVTYEVRSAKSTAHKVYVEWRDEFNKLRTNDGSWSQTTTEWTEQSFIFLLPEKSTGGYMALTAKAGGEVEFRNIRIEQTDDSNLLKNPNFFFRGDNGKFKSWQLIAGESMTAENGVMTLTPKADANAVLAQWDILVIPGRRYKVSAEVRGLSAGQFRIYTEWRIPDPSKPNEKGRLSSYGGYWRSVGTEWKQDTFFVTIPENARGTYLVLGSRRAGVQFRNVRIEEVPAEEIPQEASVGGGRWILPAGAVFVTEAGKPVLTMTPGSARKLTATLSGIRVQAGKRYELSYTIQGRGQAGSDTGFHPFRFTAVLPGIRDDGGPWDDTQNGIRNKSFEFTVPENFTGTTASITIETSTRGAIALWNFAFRELPPRPPQLMTVELTSPYFRDTLYAGDRETAIAGEITVNAPSAKVVLTSERGQKIAEVTATVSSGKGTFSIPATQIAVGKYKLTITAVVNGTEVKIEREISKLAAAPSQVAWHPNGYFICNGQPFVPVISWTVAGTASNYSNEQIERAFYYAAKNGINSMIFRVNSCEEALRYLNLAQKYGMKLFFAPGNSPAADDNTLAIYENRIASLLVKEVKEHPALLGYFLVDEPYWRGIPSSALIESYNILKFIDPNHPVWINAAPRGTVDVHREYGKAADIYGVDVYPIPQPSSHSGLDDKGMTSIGKYVFRMQEACGPHKPIIMALQGFAWGEGKADRTAVYPTLPELRFMTYDAITAGGTGVSYWGTQGILQSAFYTDVLYVITRELQQISGVLTAGERASVQSSDPAVRLFARKVNGKIYVIAANASDKAVQVTLSGLSAAQVQVINENRAVSVSNGALTDNFDAYGVHIYAEGDLPAPTYGVIADNADFDNQENPVFTYMREVRSRIPYSGTASWLWTEANARRAFSKLWICKEFTCGKEIRDAKLIISADDVYNVWINGRPADADFPKSRAWNLADYIDVTAFIKAGGNVISIYGEDSGIVPCGVIADLVITYTDGTVEHIVTDNTWFASDKLKADWMNPAVFTQWPKAFVVAPYGSGPWSNGMQMRDPDFK